MTDIDPKIFAEMQAVYHKARREILTPEGSVDIEKSLEYNSKIANDIREKYLQKFITNGEKTKKFPVYYLATINAFSEHFNERVESAIKDLPAEKYYALERFKIQNKYYKTKDENGHQIFESSIVQGGNHAAHLYSSERQDAIPYVLGVFENRSKSLATLKSQVSNIMKGGITYEEETQLMALSEKSHLYNIAIIRSKNNQYKPQTEIFIYEEGRGAEAHSISSGKPEKLTPKFFEGVTFGSDEYTNKPDPLQKLFASKGKF